MILKDLKDLLKLSKLSKFSRLLILENIYIYFFIHLSSYSLIVPRNCQFVSSLELSELNTINKQSSNETSNESNLIIIHSRKEELANERAEEARDIVARNEVRVRFVRFEE